MPRGFPDSKYVATHICDSINLPRDRSRRRVLEDLQFTWRMLEGDGTLQEIANQEVEYRAPAASGLARIGITVTQRDVARTAEALITVTDSLDATVSPAVVNARGLPGYTFERAAGELWRCRFDGVCNIITVNSGHRDFVFATRNRALQLRYLVRLYVRELVMKNFAGAPPDQLLERMIRGVVVCRREAQIRVGSQCKQGMSVPGHPPIGTSFTGRFEGNFFRTLENYFKFNRRITVSNSLPV